jgi:diaminopimelate decarboxylase
VGGAAKKTNNSQLHPHKVEVASGPACAMNTYYEVHTVGLVESPFPDRRGCPRQPAVVPASECTIRFAPSIAPATLEALDQFSHCWVLFMFSENADACYPDGSGGGVGGGSGHGGAAAQSLKYGGEAAWSGGGAARARRKGRTPPAKVAPPRLGGAKVGVFSTRSPHRPNPIGLSVCRVLSVDAAGRALVLGGVDFIDRTPVLDVKPYVPYDAVPGAVVPRWIQPLAGATEVDAIGGGGGGEGGRPGAPGDKSVSFAPAAAEALEALATAPQLARDGLPKGLAPLLLRAYAGRPEALRACVAQVVAQDPRAVHQGRGTVVLTAEQAASAASGVAVAGGATAAFTITIDGIEVSFFPTETGMLVTDVRPWRPLAVAPNGVPPTKEGVAAAAAAADDDDDDTVAADDDDDDDDDDDAAGAGDCSAPSSSAEALPPPPAPPPLERLRFLTAADARRVRATFGTPAYVYDLRTLKTQARAALAFPHAYGLTVRYAMKAAPNAVILRALGALGLHVDASSGYEALRAMAAGFAPERISLSSQELPTGEWGGRGDEASAGAGAGAGAGGDAPPRVEELLRRGVLVNCCSLRQLELLGRRCPGAEVGLRVNPGMGSGGTGKTNVGGPASSFGIWHGQLDEAAAIAARHRLAVVRVHTHIGSGSDPAVWTRVSALSIGLCRRFPRCATLNLGGGYKVGRMATEASTELRAVGAPVVAAFEAFAAETGRRLALEIEPGTFLAANSGCVVATVQDVVRTGGGPDGHTFYKLDSGMTEVLRPSLYGAQHPLVVVPAEASEAEEAGEVGEEEAEEREEAIVVGHCCESGDLLTPAPSDPEALLPRPLRKARAGDLCVIEGAGAYCSSMATKNYNSFPEACEVLRDEAGELHLVRRRQTPAQVYANEVVYGGAL